jgi:Caspase domain
VLRDANYKAMDSTLKRAGRNALSFFYYSGHGVSNPETQINYLIPVDVTDVNDDKLWFESFQQNTIIDLLSKQAPSATHYVVFDACRNELNIAGAAAKALGTDKGFVPITDTIPGTPMGIHDQDAAVGVRRLELLGPFLVQHRYVIGVGQEAERLDHVRDLTPPPPPGRGDLGALEAPRHPGASRRSAWEAAPLT